MEEWDEHNNWRNDGFYFDMIAKLSLKAQNLPNFQKIARGREENNRYAMNEITVRWSVQF